ncbi:dUTP diphosphatase [Patescibacteria group bacterium]|nr:dUTP diphosphatase [Patescibacteria group bacterium]
MKLKIKLFDKTLPLPEYKTKGAAGIDLYSRIETVIKAKEIAYVPLNVAIKLPKNCWALLAARSSLHKEGLMMINGIGVGDSDYSGDEDEYKAALYNFSDHDVVIERGQRLVQLIVVSYEQVEISAHESLGGKNRGGFGSTGKK